MKQVVEIPVREIQLSKSRDIVPATVESLTQSIRASGLINPISVKKTKVYDGGVYVEGYRVVAGNHRLSAFKAMGSELIPAYVVEGEGLELELIEIDENLCRAELSPAQRAAAILRRKEIWEALHPRGNSVPTSAGDREVGFATDTSKVAGMTKRSINEHAARAEALGDDIKDVVGTSLDKGVELDALKDLPKEERRELIERAKAGEKVSAREFDPKRQAKRIDQALSELMWIANNVPLEALDKHLAATGVSQQLAAVAQCLVSAATAKQAA